MYQKNARRRRAAPPSAAALTALAQPPSRVCTPHACLSRHRSSLRLCVSRGVPFALPVLVVFGGFVRRRRRRRRRRRARASARAPERLAFSRGEPRCRVAARGTAPAHLEPRAYAPGVERVRACHDAHVLSSLNLVATHEARRGFAFVAEERRPIAVAGYTPRKRRDRGVGRWAGWLITSRVVYALERRRRRRGAHRGVVAGRSRPARREHRLAFAVDGVARSRFASRGFARTPPSALSRFDAAPAPASVAIGDESGVERVGARAAAAAVHQEHHGEKYEQEHRHRARRFARGGGGGRGRGHAQVVVKGRRLARAVKSGRRERRCGVVPRGVRAGCVVGSGGARAWGEVVVWDVPKEPPVDVAPHTRATRSVSAVRRAAAERCARARRVPRARRGGNTERVSRRVRRSVERTREREAKNRKKNV